MHSQISPGLCFIVFTESGIVEIAKLHLVVTMHAAPLYCKKVSRLIYVHACIL